MVLRDRLDPNQVNPVDIWPDYAPIINLRKEDTEIADIILKVGFSYVDACLRAADRVDGTITPADSLLMLKKTVSKARSAIKLEQLVKKLEKGEDVNVADGLQALSMLDEGYREMTPMNEVRSEGSVWVPTGYAPIDKHIGGIPQSCLTIIGASPGVGKTTLMLEIVKSMVRKHKKSYAAVYTLEMTMAQLTDRAMQLDETLTENEKSRILLSDHSYTIQEVYAQSSTVAAAQKLCVIAVDFADQLVEGEQSESVMGQIYRSLSMLAKKTGVPVLLISQLNREAYKTGGIPKVNHLRYSGMAEAMAALIILVYNPNNIMASFDTTNTELEVPQGRAYLLVGKSRFGFKEGGPGGIMVEWDGLTGWGDRSFGYYRLQG